MLGWLAEGVCSRLAGRLFTRTFAALKPGAPFLVNVANNGMLRDGGLDLEVRNAHSASPQCHATMSSLLASTSSVFGPP